VLSISAGFGAALSGTGRPDRAIILRTGSDTEMTSNLQGQEVTIIKQAPGILKQGDTDFATGQMFVVIDVPKKSAPESSANVPMRGIEPVAMKVRDEVSVVEGRMFRFGTDEVIVGKAANRQFVNMNIGDTIVSGQSHWKVVGLFEADGGIEETEIWCDVHALQGTTRQPNVFSSVVAKLESPEVFDQFSQWLMSNPQIHVIVRRENEFYKSQSETMTALINGLGYGIAALMGLGAVFGAILTMYTAVAARTREIATLRALGFNTLSVIASVLLESLVLGAVGGLIGGAAAYVAFNGLETSTMNFQTFSQVAFAFRVTPQLLITGLTYALVMAFVGGLLPAIRAARLPIPSALREL
jgi:putative ABC transport system permease protein